MENKLKVKDSNNFDEIDPFNIADGGCSDLILVFFSYLITPVIFYIIGYLLFGSHRLSFFLLAPFGLLLNFLFIKIVIIQRKIMLYLIFSGLIILIVYKIFQLFYSIWYALPN
jgi:hypothetical protein